MDSGRRRERKRNGGGELEREETLGGERPEQGLLSVKVA